MPELTAANLAKSGAAASDADWACGLINLVIQAVGTMAMLSAKGHDVNSVVFTGAVATLDTVPGILKRFEDCYGIKYLVAKHAECATAVGAAML